MKINECCGSGDVPTFATPMNTTGMGNPSDTSGDILAITQNTDIKRKKHKKLKSLKQRLNDNVKSLNKYIDEKQ